MQNKWNERYGGSDYYYGTEPNSFLRAQSHLFFKGAKVLCLAEGEGRNAVFLAQLGCQVTAVDSSQAGLEKLSRLAKKNNVQVEAICADLAEYQFAEKHWDFIVSIWCHLPSALRGQVHRGCLRGLKPGGIFILEAYRPKQLEFKTGGPPDPDLMPTQAQLETELSGLEFLVKREIERPVSEGVGHQGMSAVVQVVGRL